MSDVETVKTNKTKHKNVQSKNGSKRATKSCLPNPRKKKVDLSLMTNDSNLDTPTEVCPVKNG